MEFLDIVDATGEPTGETIPREEAHRRGVLHRTSHVWLIRERNGKTQVLLQKRSADKDSFPGCYDISSAGHIPAGEGFVGSALRELEEELGIAANEGELIFRGMRSFEFCMVFHGREFHDRQVSGVYSLARDGDEESYILQSSEIESVLWMDLDECVDMVKNKKAPNCIELEELEMLKGQKNT